MPSGPDSDLSKRERIAAAVAAHLADGWLVNVGFGLPGLVPHRVPDERGTTFHAEHGVVGFGSGRFGPDGESLAFFGTPYRLQPGGFISGSSRSFAIVRAGMLDATVLGAFEVTGDGRMVNCRGADTDLAVGTRRADLIVTELGSSAPTGSGFRVVDLADGVDHDTGALATGAELVQATRADDRVHRRPRPCPRRRRERHDRHDRRLGARLTRPADRGPGRTGGVTDLTIIMAGSEATEPLNRVGAVGRMVTSFGSYPGNHGPGRPFEQRLNAGELTVELCSQGVRVDRVVGPEGTD